MQQPSKTGLWELEELDTDVMLKMSRAQSEPVRTQHHAPAIIKKKQEVHIINYISI